MSVMCAMMASFSVDFFFPSLEEDRRRRSGFEMAWRDVDDVVNAILKSLNNKNVDLYGPFHSDRFFKLTATPITWLAKKGT